MNPHKKLHIFRSHPKWVDEAPKAFQALGVLLSWILFTERPGPGRFSDSSILRQFDIPTVRYSESWTNNVNLPNIPKIKENFLQ